MSVSLPVVASSAVDCNKAVRSTANFRPNIWGDRFLTYNSDEEAGYECKQKQIEELKEEVRKDIKAAAIDNFRSPELLKLIDSIQLLGVAYHFKTEIGEALKEMYEEYTTLVDTADEDLATSSLRFRLLRQGGYHIPPDVFSKFKDKEGKFKESLIGDTEGMLALYEASHLMVNGEDILEEALAFTTTHLQSIASNNPNNNPLSERVIRALKRPIHKALTRVEARHYISIYQQDHEYDSHNSKSLLKLAKLDFNLLQSLHKKELSEINRWWKGLDFVTKVPFARDRLVEGFFWALGMYFEPQHFTALRFLTKVTAMLSITDDIYDAYGTFQELQLLTEAVQRWDASCIDQLPADYLRWFCRVLFDFYKEMEEEMAKEVKSHHVHYAKEAMKRQVQSYFVEAKWLNQGYTPTFDEYLSNALQSSCHTALITTSLVGMGDVMTEETLQWVLGRPKMIKASEIIGRIMNDLVSSQYEKSRKHIPTSVECYMKQFGVTKEEANAELNNQVVMAWKDINKECLIPTHVPMEVIIRVLDFTRVEDVVYKERDEYTHVGKLMRNLIASTLIDPVPI